MLAFPYLVGVALGYGLVGVYAGVVLAYACRVAIVVGGFRWAAGPTGPRR